MQLGIFAKTFACPTVEDVFDAVRAHGLRCVQFNLSCAGVPSLPDEIAPSLITRIREAAQSRDIGIAAVSGTYNMIHPDQEVQLRGQRRLRTLAAACRGVCRGGCRGAGNGHHYALYRDTRSRKYVALASRERFSPVLV